MKIRVTAVLLLSLAACGRQEGDNVADQLRNAAGQSTPEAANVLENEAERVEDMDRVNAQAEVQSATQNAGNAQIGH